MPGDNSPKTTFLKSHHGAGAVVMKNCESISGNRGGVGGEGRNEKTGRAVTIMQVLREEQTRTCDEFEFGPRLAIESSPGRSCFTRKLSSAPMPDDIDGQQGMEGVEVN